jgi:hypothetical protein
MKRGIKIFGAIFFVSMLLTSCSGGSIEQDAKKMADLQCQAQQLSKKAMTGDMSVIAESTKLASDAAALSKELEGKYTSDEDKRKFGEALLKEMANCN